MAFDGHPLTSIRHTAQGSMGTPSVFIAFTVDGGGAGAAGFGVESAHFGAGGFADCFAVVALEHDEFSHGGPQWFFVWLA